jgi:hypothetical protein
MLRVVFAALAQRDGSSSYSPLLLFRYRQAPRLKCRSRAGAAAARGTASTGRTIAGGCIYLLFP